MVSTRASSPHHETLNDDLGHSKSAHLNNPAISALLPPQAAGVAALMETIIHQILGLTDTVQLLVQQQQAMSQLVGSQLNHPKVPREGANPPQSLGVRNDDIPAA